MVYIKKNSEKSDKKKNSEDKKIRIKKINKNPLKEALTSGKTDKRKTRKSFFTDKTQESRPQKSKEGYRKKSDDSSQHKVVIVKKGRFSEKKYEDNKTKRNKTSANPSERKPREQNPREQKPRERNPREQKPFDASKRRKRNVTAESEILSEIVYKRRMEGRSSERSPKILSLSWSEERGPIRLNKYIANAGICSRRDADKLIESGAVKVNGIIVTELGTKVMPTDEVRYEDKILQREKPVYILLNKPKDYITTVEDELDRKHVMMLIKDACEERVYPVGRLDRNTTGLLLFTNDGEMAKKLTHPRYGVRKIYHIELDRKLELADFDAIANGIKLHDGIVKPDEIAYVGDSQKEIGITIHSGKNRIVRRIFEHFGYTIEKLDRVSFAGLTKKDLPRGHWRFLKKEEINILKMST